MTAAQGDQRTTGNQPLSAVEDVPILRTLLDDPALRALLEESLIPSWMRRCRWFGGKASGIETCAIAERLYLDLTESPAWLVVVQVAYQGKQRVDEHYALFLSWMEEETAAALPPQGVVAEVSMNGLPGRLIDGLYLEPLRAALWTALLDNREFADGELQLNFLPGKSLSETFERQLASKVLNAEQSNSTLVYGDHLLAKLYRKVEAGINPDIEITRFLTEQAGFEHVPAYRGEMSLALPGGKNLLLAMFQDWVPNRGDAFSMTLEHLSAYYRQLEGNGLLSESPPALRGNREFEDLPPNMRQAIGRPYYQLAGKLALRTAEMHRALATGMEGGAFTAEDVESRPWAAFCRSTVELVRSRFEMLRGLLGILKEDIREEARSLLGEEDKIVQILESLTTDIALGRRCRIHGDYHLGQVLFTGDDFYIIDFEGEPDKPHSERRRKHSPLKDVAGMVRSFHYAVHVAIIQGEWEAAEEAALQSWARAWYDAIAGRYLACYLEALGPSGLLPASEAECMGLLRAFILEKAVYELGYELNNRPDWVAIPLQGIRHIINRYGRD